MRDTLFDVENMNVLVIGGSGGIGWAVAKAFIQRKAHVVVADKKEQKKQAGWQPTSVVTCRLIHPLNNLYLTLGQFLRL